MEIVFAHNSMDFDALAAQFAVTKLVPGTRMVPGYPLVGNIREFLALYRDTLPLAQLKYINYDQVDHVFIVDCQHIDRLDETVRRLLNDPKHARTYTIFDHHPVDPEALGPNARADSIIEPAGSTTTLLVDHIRKRKMTLTPFEATLLLLGIYEDTGCLTYGGTTYRDAECVAYLLKQGGDLTRVGEFLNPKMSDEQTKLLEQLISSNKTMIVSGIKVVIATGQCSRFLDGLATLTRKLLEIESADVVISIVKMRDRVHLVGRSETPAVDVRLVLRKFGGDGHPGAGSAVTRQGSVEEIAGEVKDLLQTQIKPERIAAEIMLTPVRTIRPRTTMEEAGRLLLRYALDGLVVTDGDQVVGVVSRRDIDQAQHHKLSHAPVQGFMSKPVITIAPESPLSEIQRIMVKEDVGKLPVLDDTGKLVGIVTRREVMDTLFGQPKEDRHDGVSAPANARHVQMREKMSSLDEPTQWLFEQVGIAAAQLNMVAYSVGGCVRDLILGRPNFDLDFVVEGSAIELAQYLQTAFPGRIRVAAKHERFQTATADFYCHQKREIDFSTARLEFYEFPAALPTVEASSLRHDLFRRDFTINALAICLNPGRYGELVDYFNGLEDLRNKVIRILHPFSFIEDPTRIIRAARFAARLGFQLDPKTREQAERAVGMGIFDDVGGFRMRTELQLILESPQRMKALDLLGQLGGRLRYLDSQLEWGPRPRMLLRRAERLFQHYKVEQEWVVFLALLLAQLDGDRRKAVIDRLHLSNDQRDHIEKGLNLPQQLNGVSVEPPRSIIRATLHGYSDQALAIAACLAKPGSQWRRMIKLYLEQLRHVEVFISGADLLHMGFSEGPEIGRVLSRLTEAKLDGQVSSLEDEITFVKQQLPEAKH